MKTRFPRSTQKYIRLQKARIRREFLDIKEQKERIDALYEEIKKLAPK